VAQFGVKHGLAVTGQHPNRVVLDVEGGVGEIEKAFHVTLRTYRHPREARALACGLWRPRQGHFRSRSSHSTG